MRKRHMKSTECSKKMSDEQAFGEKEENEDEDELNSKLPQL